MNSKFFSAKNVALLGILIALVIVLQLFASAIPMFGVTLNFSLIPIALAAILLGPLGGAIVGFICGLVVFITMAILGHEPSTAYLFQTNPVILTIMCIGKTTLAGVASGLLFNVLKKINFHTAVIVGSLIIPIVNTGIYMLGIVLMKESAAEFMALTTSSAGAVFAVVFGLIWLNFVLEIVITAIFTPMLYRLVKIFKKGD
ncbi:MAG: ECF transporter S component [Clostridiales bacterium]|nr:ECF transporter S component [Clostridiales bacterium]